MCYNHKFFVHKKLMHGGKIRRNTAVLTLGRTTGRTDAEASVFWSFDANRRLIGKSLVLGNTEGRRRSRRQRWLDGIPDAMKMNLGKLGDCEGKGGLACCSSWGRKESDTTGHLNNSSRIINNFVPFLWFSEILPKFSLLSIIIFTGRRKDYLPLSQFYLHSSLYGFKQAG